jgi:hypothetical protein
MVMVFTIMLEPRVLSFEHPEAIIVFARVGFFFNSMLVSPMAP